MTGQISADAVRRIVTVPVPPDRAFALFTAGFGTWWPREYTWAGDVLDVHPRPLRCSDGLSPTGEGKFIDLSGLRTHYLE